MPWIQVPTGGCLWLPRGSMPLPMGSFHPSQILEKTLVQLVVSKFSVSFLFCLFFVHGPSLRFFLVFFLLCFGSLQGFVVFIVQSRH